MKFFLMILLFCLFILVAICTYLYFLFRKKLFADMVYIGKYLKNNITFNKKNVNELLSNSFENVSQSSKFIIKNHARVGKFFYKGGDILNDFFGSLGHGDVGFECNNLDYYLKIFDENLQKSSLEMKSKALLYFKLIIGLGLAVCIILI